MSRMHGHGLFAHWLHCTFLCGVVIFTAITPANAQVDVTGSWSGFSFTSNGTFANTFSLKQNGAKVIGSSIAGVNAPGVINGMIEGDQFTFHSEYPSINYSSDAEATTDGVMMSGTFLDSQGTSGTFVAEKFIVPLTPNLTISDPPIVQVKGNDVKLVLQKFSSVGELSAQLTGGAAKVKTTIQYEVAIRGAEIRKLVTKKNIITAQNLVSGKYSVSYRASAIRNGKRLFSSRTSPKASFTVK